ncbi:MAG TPA: biotin/lipoyl-containing protein [Terriglobales bacterium]|nr:biotin/lipoyl-containing protein [Terriglobales bacterium]
MNDWATCNRSIEWRDIPQEPPVKIQIVIGGKAYEVEVEVEGGEDSLGVPGHLPPGAATIQSARVPTAPRPHSPSGVDADEARVCRSPVAGIVVRVCVQPGEQLGLDDLLVVLEAMKMETSVTAPIAGTVKSVKVMPGEAVKRDQILVEFE